MTFNVETERQNILAIFRAESVLSDDCIWIILQQAGICGSGRYSLFFLGISINTLLVKMTGNARGGHK